MTNFYRNVTLAGVASIAAVTIQSGESPALAQSQVICESYSSSRANCQMDTGDGVAIEQQYSQTPCRGRWGFARGYVWVEDGCRARFRALGNQDQRYDNRYSGGRYSNNNESYSGDDYENLSQIYRDVLDRDIDRRGYRVYSSRIKDDGWSLSRVRREVARSSEAATAINDLYRRILGRDADPAGLSTYQRQMEDGWSLRRVERQLSNSQEARNHRRDPKNQ